VAEGVAPVLPEGRQAGAHVPRGYPEGHFGLPEA
jgi:hypothetical protein